MVLSPAEPTGSCGGVRRAEQAELVPARVALGYAIDSQPHSRSRGGHEAAGEDCGGPELGGSGDGGLERQARASAGERRRCLFFSVEPTKKQQQQQQQQQQRQHTTTRQERHLVYDGHIYFKAARSAKKIWHTFLHGRRHISPRGGWALCFSSETRGPKTGVFVERSFQDLEAFLSTREGQVGRNRISNSRHA